MKQETFGYNERYLTRNGRLWVPVMGEMHYSRYQAGLWEESLRKMKAGGVSIVSTYIFWIHHEEAEGEFDFTGCRDLGWFVALCRKVGLYVFLRLGPWVHGEARNGGFPDWIKRMGEEGVGLRTNNPVYLEKVERFWRKVYEQVKDELYGCGGPVIGIQIENEYGHVGGLRGEEGNAHIRRLTGLAREIGFDVPYVTATGWGGAVVGDALPVTGGYCDAPWDASRQKLPPNPNFVFSRVRDDGLIGKEEGEGDPLSFDPAKYPFLTAELGGGLQVTAYRRPVARGTDAAAMSVVKLGSGAALLGYYMYHGGSNPKGKLSTLHEHNAIGGYSELGEINYDFFAPIRQYGTISDTYRRLRLIAYFLQDFGEDLAGLEAELTPENGKPDDLATLRLACRHDGEHGYVFFNNYQRLYPMARHENVVLTGPCSGGDVTFPPITVEDGDYGFFPYRMRLGGAVLRSALATPLCRLETAEGMVWVFYGDRQPAYEWEGEPARILHLSFGDALCAYRVMISSGGSTTSDYLILAEDFVWEENGKVHVTGGADTVIRCFPEAAEGMLPGFRMTGRDGEFTVYRRVVEEKPAEAELRLLTEDDEKTVYEIRLAYSDSVIAAKDEAARLREVNADVRPGAASGADAAHPAGALRRAGRDTLLWITYAGNSMDVYLDGEKIEDHYYTGEEVPVSLGYFGFPDRLRVEVHPLKADADIYLERWPEMTGGRACRLEQVRISELYGC